MQNWIASSILSVALFSPAFGEAPAPAHRAGGPAAIAAAPATRPAPIDPRLTPAIDQLDLKDGDTIVFLGDSITHQCLYTQFIEDYFYTRYPRVHVRFHNSGVGGDHAQDALDRFDMDVAAYKPKYVTILLGMNDGGYRQWDDATFKTYEKGMLELLAKIRDINATPIVMGPTMYDRDALLIKPNPRRPFVSDAGKYYNGVLAFYGTFMRDQANEHADPYVDMFAPLNNLTIEQRERDPNFTMIPDAIHPDANGHTVMATAFLESLHTPHAVDSTNAHLDGKSWKVNVGPGGKVSDIQGDAEHLSFVSEEPALPWILPANAAIGYRLSIAGHHQSQEPLQVQGLAPGKYQLKIDDLIIGVFPSGVLASHIELQNFEKCPQYQQALAIATLNGEKTDKTTRPLRNLYGQLKGKRHDPKTTPETLAAYIEGMKPKIAEIEKGQAEYNEKIYTLAQPKPHKFELTRIAGK